jgi:hypothetical protein
MAGFGVSVAMVMKFPMVLMLMDVPMLMDMRMIAAAVAMIDSPH